MITAEMNNSDATFSKLEAELQEMLVKIDGLYVRMDAQDARLEEIKAIGALMIATLASLKGPSRRHHKNR